MAFVEQREDIVGSIFVRVRSKAVKSMSLRNKETKLHGLSSQANYADRVTAACRRSDCQLLQIEGATFSV
jgi:hypothetical protein